ncbi:hypothetical protein B1400_1753 [Bifidobacterium italicum]|uniref:HTH marR-type domain-containing protein n=1 Tax=Bifidobacterium italicum TaxID=1960968 RepID=A0A2A2ED56_9BIFI|nr:MarR family winged helix-turn-helix transcriptional regulator [Bifidobacterium italicum]PAU66865.1 hypothetical protein B1400_1753 [Bifidobacterium italicum]
MMQNDDNVNREARQFAVQFFRDWERLGYLYRFLMTDKAISPNAISVMNVLLDHEGCTHKVICHRAQLSKQAVSGIVRILEEAGYVYTVIGDKDARMRRIYLTRLGRQRSKSIMNKVHGASMHAMSMLGMRKRCLLLKIVHLYVQVLSYVVESNAVDDER